MLATRYLGELDQPSRFRPLGVRFGYCWLDAEGGEGRVYVSACLCGVGYTVSFLGLVLDITRVERFSAGFRRGPI